MRIVATALSLQKEKKHDILTHLLIWPGFSYFFGSHCFSILLQKRLNQIAKTGNLCKLEYPTEIYFGESAILVGFTHCIFLRISKLTQTFKANLVRLSHCVIGQVLVRFWLGILLCTCLHPHPHDQYCHTLIFRQKCHTSLITVVCFKMSENS